MSIILYSLPGLGKTACVAMYPDLAILDTDGFIRMDASSRHTDDQRKQLADKKLPILKRVTESDIFDIVVTNVLYEELADYYVSFFVNEWQLKERYEVIKKDRNEVSFSFEDYQRWHRDNLKKAKQLNIPIQRGSYVSDIIPDLI